MEKCLDTVSVVGKQNIVIMWGKAGKDIVRINTGFSNDNFTF